MHRDFVNSTHLDYDLAFRKVAEEIGFDAFGKAHQGVSATFYGAQNMQNRRQPNISLAPAFRKFNNYGKRVCYAWNSEGGCSKSDDECRFGHYCSKCGIKTQTREV